MCEIALKSGGYWEWGEVALAEDLGSMLSTHMVAEEPLYL